MMNLANAYRNRIRGDRAQNLEEAIAAYRQALEIFTPEGMPDDCRRVARGLANLCFVEGRYDQVIEPYRLTMRANELLLQASLARSSKEVELGEIQGLPASAAYAFARLDRLEESIVALETGRARMLAEALEANRRDLEQLPASGHGDLLARYRAAADRLAALQAQVDRPAAASGSEAGPRRDFAALSQKIQAARAELDAAIAAIRRVPGYEDFFLPPAFEKICQAATPDAPLVYLAATPVGGMALAVHASQTPASAVGQSSAEHDASPDDGQPRRVSVVWLDDLTEARLREVIFGPADDPALGGYLGAYSERRRNPSNRAARDGWHAALDRVTRWLWDALMGPLVEHVQALGFRQVTLIPTGLLALLPLHAAWTGDASAPTGRRYALDVLTIRYAPSAVALGRSLDGATLPSDGLLAVDNPDGSLVFSNHEVEVARSYFPSDRTTVLARGAATRQRVLNRLPDFPVYHFSTHGWAGWSEPLQGGVLLADGAALTLGDILDLRLRGARLAVLSACETGIPGTKTPDEVVSIPTGLMQAGVAGVVASLWAVNELSTAMLMERFYRLWREEGLAPVAALHEAQRWLRDTTNQEKAEYFKRDALALAGFRMPEMVAVELFTYLMVRDPDARQFEHPFWWAAFCYTGA
jgi:CHAT domain-containing protein/tetratricopeptide (TPR) repeat protein